MISKRAQLLLRNCRLYDRKDPSGTCDVLIQDGKISQIGGLSRKTVAERVIDADGNILAPGFIDVHIQGAGGGDILDGTPVALSTMSTTLARLGITGFLATTVIKPSENNRHLKTVVQYIRHQPLEGAQVLGIHLEGPFINPKRRGGISAEAIRKPSRRLLTEIIEISAGTLKMMTVAPELPGSDEIIRMLLDNGIIPALGHTDADYETARKAFKMGIPHVTHIFNAMPSLHHRRPGPLLAVFENREVSAQIISDGVHLHPRIVNYLYEQLGGDRCICITDGIQAIGLRDGEYVYNGKKYTAKDGIARYHDGTLIGTAVGAGEIACRFRQFTGCQLGEAIDTITKNPASLLGLRDRQGAIEIGLDADLVIMKEDFSIRYSIIDGEVVHQA